MKLQDIKLQDIPKIFVACLAAYNQGKMHGGWILCDQDSDDILDEIEEILQTSPVEDSEEWLICDSENWGEIKIDQHEDIEKVAELAKLLVEHGRAFAVYIKNYGTDDDSLENFSTHYVGQYKSEEDFAYQLWEEEGKMLKLRDMGILYAHIDWQSVAYDLFINDYFSVEVSHEEVYVFARC